MVVVRGVGVIHHSASWAPPIILALVVAGIHVVLVGHEVLVGAVIMMLVPNKLFTPEAGRTAAMV